VSQGSTGLPQDILEDARLLFDFNQLHQELRPCSVGIGLGSHDPGVPDVTAALFHRGVFPLIVFTGANARTTRDRFPGGEAVHYRQRAIELGIPSEAILIEPRATNTRENIEFSRVLMSEHGLQAESAVLICRPISSEGPMRRVDRSGPRSTSFAPRTLAPSMTTSTDSEIPATSSA
jgi:hypothetical protein